MKKSIAFILVIALAIFIFAGCTNGATVSTASASSEGAASETRTVTDSVGRTVEIPGTIEKIVALGNTPRMIAYLGLANNVVGIGSMDADKITPVTAYAYANKDLWASVPVVGTDAAGATDYYPEQIIAVQPDVIVCSYNKELADDIQTKTAIPVVAVPMGTLFEKIMRMRCDFWVMSAARAIGRKK